MLWSAVSKIVCLYFDRERSTPLDSSSLSFLAHSPSTMKSSMHASTHSAIGKKTKSKTPFEKLVTQTRQSIKPADCARALEARGWKDFLTILAGVEDKDKDTLKAVRLMKEYLVQQCLARRKM